MNKIYLRDYPDSSVESRVMAYWNSGCSLKQAVYFCTQHHGFTAQQVIPIWRRLYREWYPRPVPLRPRSETNTDQAYSTWKGIIGPGKKLSDVLREERSKWTR